MKFSYFKKWIAFILLISVLPVVMIGIFSYYKSSGDIQDKVNEGNRQNLLQTESRVEQILRALEYSVTQYGNSPQVTSALQQSLTIDDFQTINSLSKGLNSLQFYFGIRNVYLINLDKNWVVGSEGFNSFTDQSYHDLFMKYAQSSNGLSWVTASGEGTNTSNSSHTSNTEGLITLVSKLPFNNTSKNPPGMIVIQISNAELNQFLLNNSQLGEVFVLDRNNHVMLGDHTGAGVDKKSVEAMWDQTSSDPAYVEHGELATTIHGERFWVNYQKSPYNGWTYLTIQSIHQITKDSRSIGWFTLATCLFILVVILLVAYFGTRRMYSPIQRLVDFTKNAAGVQARPTGNQDELSFVRDRIAALLDSGNEMENRMLHDLSQLREFFMIKMLRGQMSDKELTDKLTRFDFPSGWKKLAILTLQIDTLEGTRFEERDRDLLLFAISNMVGEIIPSPQRFSPIMLDESQLTLLATDAETNEDCRKFAYATAEQIKESIASLLQVTVSIGISRPFEKLTLANKAYEEGLSALKYRLKLGSGIILDMDSIHPDGGGAEFAYAKSLEQELIIAVKEGHDLLADKRLHEFMQHLRSRNLPFDEYQMIMTQLLSALTRLVYEWNSSLIAVFGSDSSILEAFYKLHTAEDTERWLSQSVIHPLIRFQNNRNESQYNNITEMVIRFIQEEYDTDLSLEACAARINFHPVYVSRVFKKETGVSFSDYLAQHRLTVAKRLLAETDMKVSEIAEKLSYSNSATFIRYFSKVEGMTPGQYRKELQTADHT
ncbi:hypothetical protein A8709_04590 [Paenibacillus pectinilyticus]|uniref:HTH araC/xylS-type domain-containing protein n=1 Tax=Paenibacillus pectinilyticus TaxID=512399 RepID=A0A1C0ZSD0_9BACL|nr:helix-turn-helix domain-containing protein [Paenibacillus pectinilyticus]OCT10985.1 hypothetical protein A8709_04590 [Paenibacillus pectinilyticus]